MNLLGYVSQRGDSMQGLTDCLCEQDFMWIGIVHKPSIYVIVSSIHNDNNP